MENSSLILQQKFSFFAVGDSCTASVFSVNDNKVNLRTKGGIIVAIAMEKYEIYVNWGLKLQVGNSIKGVVDEIIEGIPYITLNEIELINAHPQPAVVLLAGPRGIVLSLNANPTILAIYQPQEGTLIEQEWSEKDKVFCKGITFENDAYHIQELSQINIPAGIKKEPVYSVRQKMVAAPVVKVEEIPNPNNYTLPKSLTEEDFSKALQGGSLSQANGFSLGECYIGKLVPDTFLINLSEKQKARVVNRNAYCNLPSNANAVVRILKIYMAGFTCMDCVLVNAEPDYVEWFEKNGGRTLKKLASKTPTKKGFKVENVREKNGFTFGKRDLDIYNEGRNAGSEESFEQYWLGYLLEVPVVDGKPYFVNRAGVNIEVDLIDSDVVFKTGETVYVRLCFISVKGKEVKFTVQVLYTEES